MVTKEAVAAAAGEALSFGDVEAAARQAEESEGQHGRRIVKVFCADENLPELWHGAFGNAPVEGGPAGYTFSDGETVTL